MYCHKTHTKKDILKILKTLEVEVNNILSKREIIELLPKIILEDAKYKENEFKINNKSDFLSYMKNKSPIVRLNTEDKKIVMIKCKNIIQYCMNKYELENSAYTHRNEIMNDAVYIHKYGDIPSVRRAIKLYNMDPQKIIKYNNYKINEEQKELLINELKTKLESKKKMDIGEDKTKVLEMKIDVLKMKLLKHKKVIMELLE